jgi:hypothetical protein
MMTAQQTTAAAAAGQAVMPRTHHLMCPSVYNVCFLIYFHSFFITNNLI